MDDQFMHGLRATPPPHFVERLRQRLHHQDQPAPARSPTIRQRWVTAASVLAALGMFAFPSVRASAQAFLNLFRVVKFTAVPVDVGRINQLTKNGLDLPSLLGRQVEVLE